MREGFTQLTTQNAAGLLSLMQAKARLGPVQVAHYNTIGGRPFYGPLDFCFGRLNGVQTLEAHAPGGLIMLTPVTRVGFTPQRPGDSVAYYCVSNNVVTICYVNYGAPDSERTFTFS